MMNPWKRMRYVLKETYEIFYLSWWWRYQFISVRYESCEIFFLKLVFSIHRFYRLFVWKLEKALVLRTWECFSIILIIFWWISQDLAPLSSGEHTKTLPNFRIRKLCQKLMKRPSNFESHENSKILHYELIHLLLMSFSNDTIPIYKLQTISQQKHQESKTVSIHEYTIMQCRSIKLISFFRYTEINIIHTGFLIQPIFFTNFSNVNPHKLTNIVFS